MKLYRLIYFICIMLLFLFFSCEMEEYEQIEPVRITIINLPADSFPAGTRLYIGLAVDYRQNFSARGDGIINSDGTVEISLHYPVGVPWDGQDSFGGNISILENVRAQKRLYKTREWYDFREGTGSKSVTLDFSTDFIVP